MIDAEDMHNFIWSYGIRDFTYEVRKSPRYMDDFLQFDRTALDTYIEFKDDRTYSMKIPECHLLSIIETTKEYETERNIRRMNPAVDKAYRQYKMLLNLTRYEYEKYTNNKK